MKYIIYSILLFILLVIIVVHTKALEGFTTFEIDYGTGIGPWWAQGAGLNRGYHRCICSGTGSCKCINDTQFNKFLNSSEYPQYYFN
jgi:hypothetical protein